MKKWVIERADIYLRHGGKTSRRAMVQRLITICEEIQSYEAGVKLPPQIGKAHIHRYWHRQQRLSPVTLRDHFYALRLLWDLLGRTGEPPRPPKIYENLPKKGG